MRISLGFSRCASIALALTAAAGGLLAIVPTKEVGAVAGPIGLEFLGRYSSGDPDGGSEITAFDPATKRMFVTNGVDQTVDIVDISTPAKLLVPTLITQVSLGRPLQSVATKNGLVAVAIEGTTRQAPGEVVVLDTNGTELWRVTTGSLPDMVTFTPDGTKILTANEGEPLNYCTSGTATDPEGSVSIIDVATRTVSTAGFSAYTDLAALQAQGIRIFGPNATPAQDFEPEYVAVAPDGLTAFVSLQENNAVAVVDIATATVTALQPLGYQAHGIVPIDTSDRDNGTNGPAVNIVTRNANVFGMFMPDTIDAFSEGSNTYYATANEGDGREYACFPGGRDDLRVSAQGLDPTIFSAAELSNAGLGRLRASSVFPVTPADRDATGKLKKVYTYGTRSFTIRAADGTIVWDSGDDLEQRTAAALPAAFNGEWNETTGAFSGFDLRSPNKGPEPEAIETGEAFGRRFAFVGLERAGGVLLYDITNPAAPAFVQYLNTSVFSGNYKTGTAGDVSPEGIQFVPADASPNGKPLVIVSYEFSGTTAIFQLNGPPTVNVAGDTVVDEAAGTVNVDVTLSEASSETVTVDYELISGTATSGDDFAPASGTIEFAPGVTTKPVPVSIVDDGFDEADEAFSLLLSNPTNTLVGDAEQVVTITDNELPELRIDDASIAEGDRGLRRLTFTLTLSSAATERVRVFATTARGTAKPLLDYLPDLEVVRFEPGQTTKTVSVFIVGDRKIEPDEAFEVKVRSIQGPATVADGTAVGTIVNDD